METRVRLSYTTFVHRISRQTYVRKTNTRGITRADNLITRADALVYCKGFRVGNIKAARTLPADGGIKNENQVA